MKEPELTVEDERADWSEADKKAASMESKCWESNDTNMDDDDIAELKKTLEAREKPFATSAKRPIYRQEIRDDEDDETGSSENESDGHYSGFIGCPDTDTFDPDI